MRHPRTWGILWTAVLWLQSIGASEQDPSIAWTSYFGGQGHDRARGLAIGPDGSIYVGGTTNQRLDLPEADVDVEIGELGGLDVVVFKVSPDGKEVLWKAILGGPGHDILFGLDVDSHGVVTISWRGPGRRRLRSRLSGLPLRRRGGSTVRMRQANADLRRRVWSPRR